jgi:hypothetical protein
MLTVGNQHTDRQHFWVIPASEEKGQPSNITLNAFHHAEIQQNTNNPNTIRIKTQGKATWVRRYDAAGARHCEPRRSLPSLVYIAN